MALKYTTETFRQKLIEKGRTDLELIGEYKKNKNRKVKFKCTNMECLYEWEADPSSVLSGTGCPICGRKKCDLRRRKTNEKFLKELEQFGASDIEPLEEYKGAKEKIKLQCKNNPAHIWYNSPTHLLNGQGCPYCAIGHKILENDEHTVGKERPDLIKYFLKESDSFKYSLHSNKKLYFKCPDCKKVKNKLISINTLSNYGFSCEFCGDKISTPNKFIREVAIQLLELKEIDKFQLEYSPEWASPYRYDCYIKKDNLNILIEMDGVQHKTDKGTYSLGVSERDKIKNQLAKENGHILIRIDCENTEFCNLKRQLLNSDVINFVNFDSIDWKNVQINIQKNLTKKICEEYNKHDYISTKELAEMFYVCSVTIVKALKKGNALNWCNYNPQIQAALKNTITRGKPIDIYDVNNKFIIGCQTQRETFEWVKEQAGTCSWTEVLKCAQGKRPSYKNYIFKYHNPQTTKQNNQK